jgi:glutamate dehydrogenase/leucine dehydrogenase
MSEMSIKLNLEKYCVDGTAILVIDTVEKTVPAKGGIRVHPRVTEEEIASLAAEMTKKCILAGLPFGGAKGGIRLADMSQLERAMYGFGRELSKLDFIPYKWCAAPDVNTDSTAIDAFIAGCASVKGWRKARICATGKSSGIPHELGSTAYGVLLSIEKTIEYLGLDIALNGARVIVEGIGEVGGNAVKLLLEKGAQIVGVSDISGCIYSEKGLDAATLTKVIEEKELIYDKVAKFPGAEFSPKSGDLLEKDADILVLAGPGRSITAANADKLKVKLIAEGANIAYADPSLRAIVNAHRIISIPGIIANSGGVISSYEEWVLENQDHMEDSMEEKWERVKASIDSRITRNISDLCQKLRACDRKKTPLECALEIASERQQKARDANRTLRNKTKLINRDLEEKYSVFTR